MKLDKGLRRDELLTEQIDGSWRNGTNFIFDPVGKYIKSEKGFNLISTPTSTTTNNLTLKTALITDNITSVVVNEVISLNTPSTGHIYVLDDNGIFRYLSYSSYSISTFTINETGGDEDFATVNASIGNKVTAKAEYVWDKVIGIINTSDETIIFAQTVGKIDTSTDNFLSISRFDGSSTPVEVLVTKQIPYDYGYPISGEYRYNLDNELVIIWYSEKDIPRLLNLDDFGFPVDDDLEFITGDDIIYTRMFSIFSQPEYILNSVNSSGGNLKAGVYYFSIQYKLPDKSYGRFLSLSNPIFINDFSNKDEWSNIYACKPGTITSKSFSIKILNKDSKYTTLRYAILYKESGVLKSYLSDDVNITSDIITVNNISNFIEIPLGDIITSNVILEKINASTVIDNRLYVAGVQYPGDIEYQKYACDISIDYIWNDLVSLDEYKNSYKDELVLYDKKGFMPGEIYAFYIAFINKITNQRSRNFHIPGRVPSVNDKDKVVNIAGYATDVDLTTQVKIYAETSNDDEQGCLKFHLGDTSGVPSADGKVIVCGTMGYWENVDEKYIGDEFNSYGGIDLRGENVRHHKFPSLYKLVENSKLPLEKGDGVTTEIDTRYITLNGIKDISGTFSNASLKWENTNAEVGVVDWDGKWTNDTANNYVLDIEYDIKLGIPWILQEEQVFITFKHYDGVNINIIEYAGSLGGKAAHLKGHKIKFTVNVGEWIQFDISTGTAVSPATKLVMSKKGYVKITIKNKTTSGSAYGKILGIKLKNIKIPDSIASKYSHFEISYAKRNMRNMTVISSGLLRSGSDGDTTVNKRFYSFDFLNNKLSLDISHIELNYYVPRRIIYDFTTISTEITLDPAVTGTNEYRLNKVSKSKYVIRDNSLSSTNNEYREEYIDLKIDDVSIGADHSLLYTCKEDTSPINIERISCIVSAYAFKKNVYKSFYNQELVRTGNLININSFSSSSSPVIIADIYQYGGDTIHSLYGVHGYFGIGDGVSPLNSNIAYMLYNLIPVFSVSNPGYRWVEKDMIEQIFYPKYNMITNKEGAGSHSAGDDTGNLNVDKGTSGNPKSIFRKIEDFKGITAGDLRIFQIDEYYGYHNDLNSVNDLEAFIIFNPDDKFITNFPYRIHRSIIQNNESFSESWRIFLPNEYYDSVFNKGEIYNLDNDGNSLLIEHKYALFVARRLSELKFANGIVSALGDAEIFDTKPIEIIPIDGGYVGCQSKFASIKTKIGNVIIDREQGKIFLYNNEKVTEISSLGMRDWFINNLDYVSIILPGGHVVSEDNPFIQGGIFAVYDEDNNRLIISKNVELYKPIGQEISWTLSFYKNMWAFFHSYKPTIMFNNRKGLFAIDSNILYKANDDNYTCYNGSTSSNPVYSGSTIDIVFNNPKNVDKLFESFGWTTDVKVGGIVYRDKTFNYIVVFNESQHSSLINLIIQTFSTGNIRNTGGIWKFNDFKDVLKSSVKDIYGVINRNSIDELKAESITGGDLETIWYNKNNFINKFVVIRLKFNNSSNNELLQLNEVFVNSEIKQR